MGRSRGATVVGVVLAVAISTVSCSGDEAAPGVEATGRVDWEWVADCPPDVESEVVPEHVCGWIDAPLGGGEQELFVVVIEPSEPSDESPILETGTDLGMAPNYAGLAPIAQRTGRRTVIVALPGTGHSVPSLDCPGVDDLGDVPTDDPDLLQAIEQCRDLLDEQGVDPALMTPVASVPALTAVMDAIHDGEWVLMGHGTTGAAAVEIARADPDRIEALVLDTPVQRDDDWPARRAAIIAGSAEVCRANDYCTATHGDVRKLWRAAVRRASTRPVEMPRGGLDPALLERGLRWLVALDGVAPVPAMLAEAATGQKSIQLWDLHIALDEAPPLCVGWLPKCRSRAQMVLGAALSSVCPTGAGGPAFVQACRRWGVEEPQLAAGEPLVGVPTLALLGDHDPYADPDEAAEVVREWVPDAHVVVVPQQGHNVLGEDCVRLMRNVWLAGNHDQPPPPLACPGVR